MSFARTSKQMDPSVQHADIPPPASLIGKLPVISVELSIRGSYSVQSQVTSPWFLLLCWNQFPWLFQTKLMLHDYFYTCNAPKNPKVGAQIYTEGKQSGQGYFPPSWGRVWGGPRKFLRCLPENGAFWLHFCHTRDFPSVLFIFAAQEFFSENKWLKFHGSLHFPWLSMTVGTMHPKWTKTIHTSAIH